jgi:uncharacterized membrane protein
MDRLARLRSAAGRDVPAALLGAALLTLLMAVPVSVPVVGPVRVALAAAYVLIVPGYAIVAALFPGPRELDRAERLGLGIGCSLALVALLTPVLDYLGVPLRPEPILVAQVGILVVALSVATWRRLRRAAIEDPAAAAESSRPWSVRAMLDLAAARTARLGPPGRLALALVPLAAAAALSVGLTTAPERPASAFYAIGPDGFIGDYPYRVDLDGELRVTLGVENHEAAAVTFHVEIRADGPNPATLLRTEAFTIEAGAIREETVSWRMATPGEARKVHILLFAQDPVTPYRQLTMVVDVGPAA